MSVTAATVLLLRARPAAEQAADCPADQGRRAHPAGDARGARLRQDANRPAHLLRGRPGRSRQPDPRPVRDRRHRRPRAARVGRLALARAAAGRVGAPGRVRRRRGAAAGHAAVVPGVSPDPGVLLVPAAVPVLRAQRAHARDQARGDERDRGRHPLRARRREARGVGGRLELRPQLHAGDQPVRQARRPHPGHRRGLRVPRPRRPDPADSTTRSTR